ncbi:DUF4489 domain-containing protein [Hathewaya histolytica]|uniref:DUF4489 domain-containing protein n=1 Tax=Hathewaya histolytica TaxID=1498 RepID=UPI003B67246A
MNSKSRKFTDECCDRDDVCDDIWDDRDRCDDRHRRRQRDERMEDCCRARHCSHKQRLPKPVVVSCSQGSGLSLPVSSYSNSTSPCNSSMPVASVTVDTTCLCKPSVKVEFTASINFHSDGNQPCYPCSSPMKQPMVMNEEEIDINKGGGKPSYPQYPPCPVMTTPLIVTFKLTKTCGDGQTINLGTWDYAQGPVDGQTFDTTHSFSFTHCEGNACHGCCVYTVEVIRVQPATINGYPITQQASINNSSISAIAASSCE